MDVWWPCGGPPWPVACLEPCFCQQWMHRVGQVLTMMTAVPGRREFRLSVDVFVTGLLLRKMGHIVPLKLLN